MYENEAMNRCDYTVFKNKKKSETVGEGAWVSLGCPSSILINKTQPKPTSTD